MNEEWVEGRSAALQQLLDIYSGVTTGSLNEHGAEALLRELDNYLKLEIEKFVAFPSFEFDWPDYENGLDEVIGGLGDLSAAARASGPWEERLNLAEQGNQRLLEGLQLLQEAHAQSTGETG